MSSEEKQDAYQCEIIEIFITSDHEEETTSVDQIMHMRRIRLKMDTREAIAIDKMF